MKSQTTPTLLPGISSVIGATNELLRAAAMNDSPVFLTGELGTEKAFAAKLIHQLSARAQFPLTKINVSWKLPSDLGTYFRQTNGGSLLIHLQKEFPIDMQYTLVEMASDGFFVDPTSGDEISSDVRIIIMTSLDLETIGGRTPILPELRELLVSQHIEIPALRDRPEDIPAVVRYAISRARDTGRAKAKGADPQVISLFRQFGWPGNAEDLLLITAQAAISSKGDVICLEDLPENFVKQFTPDAIAKARSVGGNATGASITQNNEDTEQRSAFGSARRSSASGMPMLYSLGQPSSPSTDFNPATPSTVSRRDERARDNAETGPMIETRDLNRRVPITNNTEDETREIPAAIRAKNKADTQPVSPISSDAIRTPVPTVHYANASTPAGGTQRETGDLVLPRMLSLARRLNSQSKVLGKQISGPLSSDSTAKIPGMLDMEDILSDTEALLSLEKEIDRGLDLVMGLRRQMAVLNMRHVESAETIRDLVQRLSYASDNETPIPSDTFDISQDTKQLTDNLQAIDDIIKRVSTEVPMLGKHLESTTMGTPSLEEDTQKPFFHKKP